MRQWNVCHGRRRDDATMVLGAPPALAAKKVTMRGVTLGSVPGQATGSWGQRPRHELRSPDHCGSLGEAHVAQ